MEVFKKFRFKLSGKTPIYIEQLKTPFFLLFDEGQTYLHAVTSDSSYSLKELREPLQQFIDENKFLWEPASSFLAGEDCFDVDNIEWEFIDEVKVIHGHLKFIDDLLLQRISNPNGYAMGLQIVREDYLNLVYIYNKKSKYFSSNILGKLTNYFSSTFLLPNTFSCLTEFNSYLEIERLGITTVSDLKPEPKLVRPNCDSKGFTIDQDGLETSIYTIMDVINKLQVCGLKGSDIELLARMKFNIIELLTVDTCPTLLNQKGILCILNTGRKLKYTVNSPVCFFPCGDNEDKIKPILAKHVEYWKHNKEVNPKEINIIGSITYAEMLYYKCGFKAFSITEFKKILGRWSNGN